MKSLRTLRTIFLNKVPDILEDKESMKVSDVMYDIGVTL